jgi:hypothetical protein
MASEFLENLKKAVETGEFNSEAAKKINETNEQASIAISNPLTKSQMKEMEENVKLDSVSKEEALLAGKKYKEKMDETKENDLILQQIKTLIEVEESVAASVSDMKDFIGTLEKSFDKLNPNHEQLFTEIDKVKSKYVSILDKDKLQKLLDNFYEVCALCDECDIYEHNDLDDSMQSMKKWTNINFGRKFK